MKTLNDVTDQIREALASLDEAKAALKDLTVSGYVTSDQSLIIAVAIEASKTSLNQTLKATDRQGERRGHG